jgi:hypothetical protein
VIGKRTYKGGKIQASLIALIKATAIFLSTTCALGAEMTALKAI